MAEAPRNNTGVSSSAPVSAFENFVSKHFVRLLVGIAVGGGALAFLVPWLLYIAGITGETDTNLRLHILYVTGGIIAVLGLVETRHKNTTDRAKALSEQARQFNETIAKEREKIEADKAKNEQTHMRQVHAERRSRYIAAIEQLSNDKTSIRLGGVYTLVGLVDEWLADEKAIPNIEERRKEGQVIINNLCAYIRSPFLLAERTEQLDKPYAKDLQKDFDGDKEKFDSDKRSFTQEKSALEEERQIRLTIIKEMRERLSKNYIEEASWSVFDYDFSESLFFYPIDFTNSVFDASSTFFAAKFTRYANFLGAKFTENASFYKVEFTGYASFWEARFSSGVNFSDARFAGGADFFDTVFENYRPYFTYEFGNNIYRARFSSKVKSTGYNFEAAPDSPHKIETEEQELNGVKRIIPKGTILFDPDDPSN